MKQNIETYMMHRFRASVVGRPHREGIEPTIGSRTGTAESGLESHIHGHNCGIEVRADVVKGEEPADYTNGHGMVDRFHVYATAGPGTYNMYGRSYNTREWLLTLYGDGRIKFPEPVLLIPDGERPTEYALHQLVNVVMQHFNDIDPTDVPQDIEVALVEAVSSMAGRKLRYDSAVGSPRR